VRLVGPGYVTARKEDEAEETLAGGCELLERPVLCGSELAAVLVVTS
jgi:hypothetical protein